MNSMKPKRKINYETSIEQLRQKLDVKQITEGIALNNGQLDHLLKVLEINYVPIFPQDELKVEKVKENIIALKKSGERLQKEIDEFLIVGQKILNALEKEKESEDDNILSDRLDDEELYELDHQVDEFNERGENLRKNSIKLNDAYFTLHRYCNSGFKHQFNGKDVDCLEEVSEKHGDGEEDIYFFGFNIGDEPKDVIEEFFRVYPKLQGEGDSNKFKEFITKKYLMELNQTMEVTETNTRFNSENDR